MTDETVGVGFLVRLAAEDTSRYTHKVYDMFTVDDGERAAIDGAKGGCFKTAG